MTHEELQPGDRRRGSATAMRREPSIGRRRGLIVLISVAVGLVFAATATADAGTARTTAAAAGAAAASAGPVTGVPTAIAAWNHNFVAAELGYTDSTQNGMLRARSTSVGAWETFTFYRLSDGAYAIRSNANGKFVSTELQYATGDPSYGMLRARADTIGPWEEYYLWANGGHWNIQSKANGYFVSAEFAYWGSGYAMLRARATTRSDWETFDFIRQS